MPGGWEGPWLVKGHEEEKAWAQGWPQVPASVLSRCDADNVGHVVPASPLGSGDSVPGSA